VIAQWLEHYILGSILGHAGFTFDNYSPSDGGREKGVMWGGLTGRREERSFVL